MDVSARTLVYLSYGGDPVQIAETTFGILSAARLVEPADGIRILLYTDDPRSYDDLPADVRPVSPGELATWSGADGYQHRRKAAVVRDALASSGGSVAFVDADTWFRRHPTDLFERIAPGRSVLHIPEGPLRTSPWPPHRALAAHLDTQEYQDTAGRPTRVRGDAVVWNSGVIGMDAGDVQAVDEALHLIDQIWAGHRGNKTVEQVAMSHQLVERTVVQGASDVVYHYWPDQVRRPFHPVLLRELERTRGLPPAERAEVLHRIRPRLHALPLAKHLVKRAYRATGRQWPRGVPGSAT